MINDLKRIMPIISPVGGSCTSLTLPDFNRTGADNRNNLREKWTP